MHAPAASTVAAIALIPLVALRVHARFRRACGRQRLSRYRGPISLAIYAALIGLIAGANRFHPAQLLAFVAALAAGAGLAVYALRRTRFEPTRTGLYYTPHGPTGLSLAVLFTARLAYRLIEVYRLDPSLPRGLTEFAQSPLTLGAFGLMAGYYGWYAIGLIRWRQGVFRAKRERASRQETDSDRT